LVASGRLSEGWSSLLRLRDRCRTFLGGVRCNDELEGELALPRISLKLEGKSTQCSDDIENTRR
jgi:hypothetical protein